MLRVNLNCYGSYTTDNVYQWDQNHTLTLTGDNIDDISAIHFCNKKCDNARVVNVTRGSGEISAPIPNELLEMPYDVIAYVHSIDNNQAKTIEIINIPIIKRVKPDEYEFVENVDIANFERLEKDINDFISSITIQQNTFESDFMTEYNNRVASGYFLGPDGATALNNRLNRLENDTDARLDLLEQQIIDVDALNDASGSPILLTDTAEGVLTDFAVYGKSTQDGEPTPDNPITIKSIGTFDGELLQGAYSGSYGTWTSTSSYVCSKNMISCEPNDKIKLEYATTTSQLMILYYDINKTYISYTQATNTNVLESIAVENACYFNININNVNGVTPQNAKKIDVTINGRQGITINRCGKNLLKNTATTQTINGITFTVNDDKSITIQGTQQSGHSSFSYNINNNFILPKGTYVMNGFPFADNGDSRFLIKVNNSTVYVDGGNGITFTLTEDSHCNAMFILVEGKSYNGTFYPMIRPVGSDATYEPYKEGVNYIPLLEQFRGVGNVSDEITSTTITRRFISAVFDGSDEESWDLLATTNVNTNIFRIALQKKANFSPIICSHFKYYSGGNEDFEHIRLTQEVTPMLVVWVNKTRLTTLAEWKEWLHANPITVIYELAEPIVENIEPFEIVTYDDVTYFTATANAPMWVEYYSNSPIGKRLSNTNEEMKNEHDAIKATLGYMTTEKNHIKQCLFYVNQTYAGVDITVNEDNSFTLNGTASQDINYNQLPGYLESGATYILSGCPFGGGEDSYYLKASYRTNSGIAYATDIGEGVEFTNGEAVELSLLLFIKAGTTFDNVTFYPMLRYATIEDDTYEPYGLNVKHRFEELDRKNHLIDSSRISIDPSSTGENVINKGYPDGFTRDNCIVSGVSYGYRSGGYGTEAPSRYYNDAVVVLEADNIAIHINGNGSSSFVDVKILLTKIS